ncbi:MAG: hypothetical protein JWR06_248 [Jatrophihabitans sp.]|nr:hypothetical protein [Jatrophihabitans sp.]
MGRANVYLPDELERRVKAAQIPISEVCQRALQAALEAVEGGGRRFDDAAREQLRRGRDAGDRWARSASSELVLRLVRDQRFEDIPAEALPGDLYSLTEQQRLAWEAGFSDAARTAAHALVMANRGTEVGPDNAEGQDGLTSASDSATRSDTAPDDQAQQTPIPERTRIGDDAGCRIGETVDGDPVSFDPHAAVRAEKSALYAILGQGDLRARLTLTLAQDAAARGTAVVLLDVSGQLSARAHGLGNNVRVIQPARPSMPALEDLTKGAVGLGGLWEALSGLSASTGLIDFFSTADRQPPRPGHVTVLNLSGDGGGLASALSMAQAAHAFTQLTHSVDYPRLIQIDLPSTVTVPAALATGFSRLIRTARQRNAALGLSADSAQILARFSGSAPQLSTVFAFGTSNPLEADRLRDLLGRTAPILVNPPGATMTADEQTWVVMRDLNGRLGQLKLDSA